MLRIGFIFGQKIYCRVHFDDHIILENSTLKNVNIKIKTLLIEGISLALFSAVVFNSAPGETQMCTFAYVKMCISCRKK